MKITTTTRALAAAILLCLGLDRASAQIDPSVKPISNDPSTINSVAPDCVSCTWDATQIRHTQAPHS